MTDASAKQPKLGSLDVSLHQSTHTRKMNVRAMSSRKLITNRHDDLLRSGSTHQLLNRPTGSGSLLGSLGEGSAVVEPLPPAGAAESLATEDTDDESGSEFSGGSFGEAEGDAQADKEYLRKDLGASMHDDEDEDEDDGDDGLISDMKNRMKLDAEKEESHKRRA